MKKRTILSIIITVVCIALTNKFWFCVNPLEISFNAQGAGDTKFEFFLNKEDNNDFKRVKYGVIEANLDEEDSIKLFINRVHEAKRVKLTISGISTPPPQLKTIVLRDLQLRHGKYKLEDLKAFSAEGAKLKINGDKLVIFPEAEAVSLIYNKPVSIKPPVKFDIKVLIVIAVLSFLTALKLTSYLADFKTLNNASRMDIIFLTIFFILLFIPMSHIDTQTNYNKKENRSFAKYKPFINDKQINFEFGNNLDSWFNDRFTSRLCLIENYVNLKYRLALNYFEYKDYVINKKNNWVFFIKSFKTIDNKEFTENANTIIKSIIAINNYCKKHNIKLYIFISPTKEYIYKENNLYLHINAKNSVTQFKEYFEKELKKENIAFIFPVKEFRNQRNNDLLFYKTDNHWTEAGAFLGYQILMNRIKKDFKDINILDKNFFDYEYRKELKFAEHEYYYSSSGRSVELMFINDNNIADTKYKYFKIKNSNEVKVKEAPDGIYFKTIYNDPYIKIFNQTNTWLDSHNENGKHKAFILGNSFTAAITPYFIYTFNDMVQRRYNINAINELSIRLYKKDIEKLKPDILIICINFAHINDLKMLERGLD